MDINHYLNIIINTSINNINNDENEMIDDRAIETLWSLNNYNYNKLISKSIGNLTNNGVLYNFLDKYSKLKKMLVKDIKFKHYSDNLELYGYTILDIKLNSTICDSIIKELENKDFRTEVAQNNTLYWIKNQDDVLMNDTNSFISDIAFDPFFLEIAKNYLGTNPIFIQSNYWITEYKNSHNQQVDKSPTHCFHQDYDDINFLKIFIYLTDVTEKSGPHRYIKSSLKNIKTPVDYKPSDRLTNKFINENYKNDIVYITGSKGTIIVENTHGFHSGTELQEGKRNILQLEYGISKLAFTNHRYSKSNLVKNNFMKEYPICFSKFKDIV